MSQAQPVVYEFGLLQWASTETIGFRMHITVKLRENADT